MDAKSRYKLLSFVGALALMLTMLASRGVVNAQDATSTPAVSTTCPDGPDSDSHPVVVQPDETVDSGWVIVRHADNPKHTDEISSFCADATHTVTATEDSTTVATNAWKGYANDEYTQNDGCRQAQIDLADSKTDGSWNAGYDVTFNGQAVPATCGVDRHFRSVQKDEVVPKGTFVLIQEVDFSKSSLDVRATTLDKDTKQTFTDTYRFQMWVYDTLDNAQGDVCPQATHEADNAKVANAWDEGFTVTINTGQPLTGCGTAA